MEVDDRWIYFGNSKTPKERREIISAMWFVFNGDGVIDSLIFLRCFLSFRRCSWISSDVLIYWRLRIFDYQWSKTLL